MSRRSGPEPRLLSSRAPVGCLLPLALSACSDVPLNPFRPNGPVAADDTQIMIDATLIMLAIIVPTLILAFLVAWRYRASNAKAEYLPYWSYSGRIEAVVWSIPILTIMFLGGVIWVGTHRLDPFRPLPSPVPPVEVQVVSLDWKWLFIYPRERIATVNQLVVPAGQPVRFRITSASVLNTFFVPRMGSMIYAMPGMVSELNLQADRPALMMGQSAHFSGDGFSDMQFAVRSVPAGEFAAWVRGARGSAQVLDLRAYAELARQSHRDPPRAFGNVDPRLFHAIATQAIPPAAGPDPGHSAHTGREATPAGRH
jgi:cytochrome o ubiquinol oxidase subunit II